MLTIGLTGGIGSGKSVVAEFFAELGIPLIDADVIAKELTESRKDVIESIQAHFGAEVLNPEGKFDRKRLRKVIFSDPKERLWLEALLHPLIIDEIQRCKEKLQAPYCLVVAPLLIEAPDPYTLVDQILVVDAPESLQITRTRQRDHLSEVEVKEIMQTQVSRQQRLQLADAVIQNNSDIDALREQVQHMHQYYLGVSENVGA